VYGLFFSSPAPPRPAQNDSADSLVDKLIRGPVEGLEAQ